MKNLETLVAVTHTYTHTRVSITELIARNSKTFVVPKNKRNLNYDQIPSLVLI